MIYKEKIINKMDTGYPEYNREYYLSRENVLDVDVSKHVVIDK